MNLEPLKSTVLWLDHGPVEYDLVALAEAVIADAVDIDEVNRALLAKKAAQAKAVLNAAKAAVEQYQTIFRYLANKRDEADTVRFTNNNGDLIVAGVESDIEEVSYADAKAALSAAGLAAVAKVSPKAFRAQARREGLDDAAITPFVKVTGTRLRPITITPAQ